MNNLMNMHDTDNKEFRESHEILRHILDATLDGFWKVSGDGILLDVNQTYIEQSGYTRGELLGMRISDLEAKEDIADIDEYIRKVIKTGHNQFEARHCRKDGSVWYVEVSATYLDIETGHFVAFIRDITDRKKMEETMILTQQRLEKALTTLTYEHIALNHHAIVSITDIQGNITYTNDKFSEISGYSHEELLGKNHRLIQSGRHSTDFYKDLWKTISSGQIWQGEVCNRGKNGELYWVLSTISPFFDNENNLYQYVSIRTNITSHKKMENELTEANIHAESANRAKSAFISNMSHEFRTPLNAIMGYSQLLMMDEQLSLEGKDDVKIILSSSNILLDLINDLLDISQIEAGKIHLEIEKVSLTVLVEESIRLVFPTAKEKGLAIMNIRNYNNNIIIQTDTIRLRQVILNFLTNAIKYNHTDGSIQVSCILSQHKNMVRISVRDTGIGISEVKQKEVFTEFERLGHEGSNIQGTGIGLVITKRIVEAMGGTIGFTSTEGEGSTFWVDFPVFQDKS